MKNIQEGLQVIVKKKAFVDGSLSFVYDSLPDDRLAMVTGIYGESRIFVRMACDDNEFLVCHDEIRKSDQNDKPNPRFFMYTDFADVFVVELKESNGDEFSGVVVDVPKGSYYSVGYYAKDWVFEKFTEVKRSVIYEPV